MSDPWDLCLTSEQHSTLQAHLFPGDGLEAAAILLCRPATPVRRKLMVVDVRLVPHDSCTVRAVDRLTWPGQALLSASEAAEDESLTVLLVHSHPAGRLAFSDVDDASDALAIGSLHDAANGRPAEAGHGSMIMVASGAMAARLYNRAMICKPVDMIVVTGDDIRLFDGTEAPARSPMAFGTGMTALLSKLHIGIVGLSGTGSIIGEQAIRMGVGRVTAIDFDQIEPKNLNRILNSTNADALTGRMKVEMFAQTARAIRPDVDILAHAVSLTSMEGIQAAAAADILFSCVDSAEGRYVADLIAQAFMIPLIDMGVTIPTRPDENDRPVIVEVSGRIDYVKPGGAMLFDRGVYSATSLRSEYLAREAPNAFIAQQREGYIKGAPSEAPSVITLNMRAASAAMMELIARLCPFRHAPNARYARTIFGLCDGDEDIFSEGDFGRSCMVAPGSGLNAPLLSAYLQNSVKAA